jgi:hypothetical protein
MFVLLIAVAAAVFGATAAIVLLVAWAVRREDACLTMADPPSGPVTLAVRRLLGLQAMGIAGPARPGTATQAGLGRRPAGSETVARV